MDKDTIRNINIAKEMKKNGINENDMIYTHDSRAYKRITRMPIFLDYIQATGKINKKNEKLYKIGFNVDNRAAIDFDDWYFDSNVKFEIDKYISYNDIKDSYFGDSKLLLNIDLDSMDAQPGENLLDNVNLNQMVKFFGSDYYDKQSKLRTIKYNRDLESWANSHGREDESVPRFYVNKDLKTPFSYYDSYIKEAAELRDDEPIRLAGWEVSLAEYDTSFYKFHNGHGPLPVEKLTKNSETDAYRIKLEHLTFNTSYPLSFIKESEIHRDKFVRSFLNSQKIKPTYSKSTWSEADINEADNNDYIPNALDSYNSVGVDIKSIKPILLKNGSYAFDIECQMSDDFNYGMYNRPIPYSVKSHLLVKKDVVKDLLVQSLVHQNMTSCIPHIDKFLKNDCLDDIDVLEEPLLNIDGLIENDKEHDPIYLRNVKIPVYKSKSLFKRPSYKFRADKIDASQSFFSNNTYAYKHLIDVDTIENEARMGSDWYHLGASFGHAQEPHYYDSSPEVETKKILDEFNIKEYKPEEFDF